MLTFMHIPVEWKGPGRYILWQSPLARQAAGGDDLSAWVWSKGEHGGYNYTDLEEKDLHPEEPKEA